MQNCKKTTHFLLQELAERLQGQIEGGDGRSTISNFATLQSAGPEDISFVASEKMQGLAMESRAGALIVPPKVEVGGRPVIRVPEVWSAVSQIILLFNPPPPVAVGIAPTAIVGEGANLGEGVGLGNYVVIGARTCIGDRTQVGAGVTIGEDVEIGEDCIIFPGVHILHNVQIGNRVVIQPGACIGGEGFKFEMVNGAWMKIPQVGTIIIEDDVEIGANATVDRAFLDTTFIGRGSKIDNLVQVAHNVHIGQHSLMCAYVGLSGSVKVGDYCVLAGRVGVKDGVVIGDRVIAGAAAGIKDDIPEGEMVIGTPAVPMREFSRVYAASRKGPEALKRLKSLEDKMEQLTKNQESEA